MTSLIVNYIVFACSTEEICIARRRRLMPARREELQFLTNMEKLKKRWRGTRISEEYQATIPIDARRVAGWEAVVRVIARADGLRQVVLEGEGDVLASFPGSLTGVFEHGMIVSLRHEWN